MSDQEHSHEPCGDGHHDHGRDAGPFQIGADPGSKSLADALRVSFVLLAVIMAFMLVGFLLTGLESIESNEVGVVKVFGRVVRIARPGLTYNWPFPIGRIEIVKTDEQRMTIYDFWINELPGEAGKPLSERKIPSDGLRPGWDGALLTGDRYLLHMRIDCRYTVQDARAFRRWVRDKYGQRLPGSEKTREIDPKQEIVRSAVCSAAIIAAATRTADGLQTSDRRSFSREVMRLANTTLGGEGTDKSTGLVIRRVVLAETTWPLRAREDYEAVLGAKHRADEITNTALSEAEKILRRVAGEAHTQLVGKPWGIPNEADEREKARKERKPYDLITTYSEQRTKARNAPEQDRKALEDQADDTLRRIDEVLLSNDLKGEASRIISEARAYASETKQQVQARVDQYERLWPEYKRAPRLTMERLWAAAREEILAAADEKYYISSGKGKIIVKINRDPAVVTRQVRESLDAAAKAREEKEK